MLFWIIYFERKVRRFSLRLCPNKRMSCVGKFRRNVLDYNSNVMYAIFFTLFASFISITNSIFRRLEFEGFIHSREVFYLNCLYWIVCTEIPFLWVAFQIYRNDIRSKGENKEIEFYVRRPSMAPRRSQLEVSRSFNTIEKCESKTTVFSRLTYIENTPRLRHGPL